MKWLVIKIGLTWSEVIQLEGGNHLQFENAAGEAAKAKGSRTTRTKIALQSIKQVARIFLIQVVLWAKVNFNKKIMNALNYQK